MVNRTVTTIIDPDRCIGCGECVRVCPSQTLAMKDGKAMVTGASSLGCDHCLAVCPVEAVRVEALDPDSLRFHTFSILTDWLPYGVCDPAELVRLMASRRSCRCFEPRRVERSRLEDLVKTGATPPSGTNSQSWTFTVLPSRAAATKLGHAVGAFFKRLNRMAANPWLRNGLRLIGRGELADYYRDYHQTVAEGLSDWEERGLDRLFHGATAAIIVGSAAGMELSRQLLLNPFQAVSESERNCMDPTIRDALKTFAVLDGAFVVREDGVVLAAGRYLQAQSEKTELPMGLGARHSAAAAMTAQTSAVAVTVSQTTGAVRVFKGGQIVLELHQTGRRI